MTNREYPNWHSTVAGAVAGAGSRMIVAPLDLVRIRMQLHRSSGNCKSMLAHAIGILRNEGGVLAFYRGNLSATHLWIAYSAVQFTIYEKISGRLKARLEKANDTNWNETFGAPAIAFVSGAAAGVCATFVTYPLDMSRTTFAAKGAATATEHGPNSTSPRTPTTRAPSSIKEFVVQLFRQQGIRGFYAGITPAVLQIIPYMGLNFAIYDFLTRKQSESSSIFGLVLNSGVAGAISGGCSKAIVYPFDTIKRRLQIQAYFVAGRGAPPNADWPTTPRYRNMRHCALSMLRSEGLGSFYRGLTASVLKTTVATSFSFAFFTFTRRTLASFHDEHRFSDYQKSENGLLSRVTRIR